MNNNISKLRNIYNSIKDSKDEQFVKKNVLQIKNILQTIYNNDELSQQDLSQLQIILGNLIESTVDNGLLTPHDIQQSKDNITNIESSQIQANNTAVAIGLAAILLSCSNIFAGINNKSLNGDKSTETSLQLKRNGFSYNLACHFIKFYEGAVKANYKDSDGVWHKNVHILYDDNQGTKKATMWDGQQDTVDFINHCFGKATIGYGDTNAQLCKKGFLTQEQATDALTKRIIRMVKNNIKIVGVDAFQTLTTKQQACLITLWYNIGDARKTPKLVRNLQYAFNNKLDKNRNPKDKKTLLTRSQYLQLAANEFLDCNKVNGRVNKGLTRRVNGLSYMFSQDIKI